jgi:Tfp pilus assembly protein PilV
MKKIIISLIVILITITACAQVQADTNSPSVSNNTAVYQLYPTQNMWTFIKLNTRNGQMWQVQYSIKDGDYRFETYLNLRSLVSKEEERDGRFILHSTQNMYNFILLDQLDGRVWQVQWSTEAENRGIIPI